MNLLDFILPKIIIKNDEDSLQFKKLLDKYSVKYVITITEEGWHIKIRGQKK